MKSKGITALFLSVTLLTLGSCAKTAEPVSANLQPQVSDKINTTTSPNRWLWGAWNITISPNSGSVEIVPARSLEMHLNAVRMLEKAPCTDCIWIDNVDWWPDGFHYSADVNLRHPFPNALKYTTFDVRGIMILDGNYTFPQYGRTVSYGEDQTLLAHPDGYTPLFNPTEFPESGPAPPILKYTKGKFSVGDDFSATLNPYMAFCEDQPRRMFPAGSSQKRTYHFKHPQYPFTFGYAVDMCWAPVDEVIDPVVDFPPEANCQEAYKIVMDIGGALGHDPGSTVPIKVEVFDHQGLDTISSVLIEAPGLTPGITSLGYSGTTGPESFLFSGVLTNVLGAPDGDYPVLARVVDTESDPHLGQVDGWQVEVAKVSPMWMRNWDGSGGPLAVDDAGNSYVAGVFDKPVDFDPGQGKDVRVSNGEDDVFLSKFDSFGTHVWTLTWGGLCYDHVNSTAVDQDNNIYVLGKFSATVDFDPGPGVDERTAVGYYAVDTFLCKFDSEGNYQWTQTWGGSSGDGGQAVTLDSQGSIYFAGAFYGTMDFDPGPGEVVRESHDSGNNEDAFLCKLDHSGNFQWVQNWGGTMVSSATDIETVSPDTVYVGGWYSGSVDLDPGPGEDFHDSTGDSPHFSRFDSSGNYIWGKTWVGVPGMHIGANHVSIDSDVDGNPYILGFFGGTQDFDPGDGETFRTSVGYYDTFLSKFNSSGEFQWVDTWGISEGLSISSSDITVDPFGNLWVAGSFAGKADFDPGPDVDEHYSSWSPEAYDIYLSKFDLDGNYQWVLTMGGGYNDGASSVAVDPSGHVLLTGVGLTDFDPGPGESHAEVRGSFLAKYPPDKYW